MEDTGDYECRFFASYSGTRLPLRPVNAIEENAIPNRNTFLRAYFDGKGTLKGFDKIVYSEVELAHRYEYHENGALSGAQISMMDEAPVTLRFGPGGEPMTEQRS